MNCLRRVELGDETLLERSLSRGEIKELLRCQRPRFGVEAGFLDAGERLELGESSEAVLVVVVEDGRDGLEDEKQSDEGEAQEGHATVAEDELRKEKGVKKDKKSEREPQLS